MRLESVCLGGAYAGSQLDMTLDGAEIVSATVVGENVYLGRLRRSATAKATLHVTAIIVSDWQELPDNARFIAAIAAPGYGVPLYVCLIPR